MDLQTTQAATVTDGDAGIHIQSYKLHQASQSSLTDGSCTPPPVPLRRTFLNLWAELGGGGMKPPFVMTDEKKAKGRFLGRRLEFFAHKQQACVNPSKGSF